MREPKDVSRSEVYRYMGFKDGFPEPHLQEIYEEVIVQVAEASNPKFCSLDTDIVICDNKISLNGFSVESNALAKHFCDCKKGVIFAATLGAPVDRLIYKYSMLSPAKAVAAQAAATAVIEMYADDICKIISDEYEKNGEYITPRFSPGYGDLSLLCQSDFLKALDAGRKIGVCLTDAGMLAPVKSITAVVGVSKTKYDCVSGKCSSCPNTGCSYRV